MFDSWMTWRRVLGCCASLATLTLASTGLMAKEQGPESAGQASRPSVKSRAQPSAKPLTRAAVASAVEAPLSPEALAIAQRVEVGRVSCELGATVNVVADARSPGYFDVHSNKHRFRMVPVTTSTGAIRLEDARAGAVWLQLANKSMLMSQKLGARLADACVTPAQATVALQMQQSPPPGLLD